MAQVKSSSGEAKVNAMAEVIALLLEERTAMQDHCATTLDDESGRRHAGGTLFLEINGTRFKKSARLSRLAGVFGRRRSSDWGASGKMPLHWHYSELDGPITIAVAEPGGDHLTHIIRSPTRVQLDKTDSGMNAAVEIDSAMDDRSALQNDGG